MRKADRVARDRLRQQIAADERGKRALEEGKVALRPRLEAEVAGLIRALLPLLEEHGIAEMKAFRVAAARSGLRANLKRDRGGWRVASTFRDSSWGGSTVLIYLLTNGEFMTVLSTDESATHASGGYTQPVRTFDDRDLELLRDGLRDTLQFYQRRIARSQ